MNNNPAILESAVLVSDIEGDRTQAGCQTDLAQAPRPRCKRQKIPESVSGSAGENQREVTATALAVPKES